MLVIPDDHKMFHNARWPDFSCNIGRIRLFDLDTIAKVKSGNADCPQIFAAVAISANICRNVYKIFAPACFCSHQMGDSAAINHLSINSLTALSNRLL